MPLFQAKIGWKMPGKREYENYRSVSFQPDAKQEIPKKLQKKFKKLKNTITASFQVKTGWKRPRKRENIKIVVPFRSNPTRNRKLKKNSKKIQRFKKYHYGFISSQNRLEKDEKEIK